MKRKYKNGEFIALLKKGLQDNTNLMKKSNLCYFCIYGIIAQI